MNRLILFIITLNFLCFSEFLCHEYDPNGWATASEWIKASMNLSADPCEDFLSFACGNWNNTYGISNTTSESSRVVKELARLIKKALNNINIYGWGTKEYKKSAKIFYDKCESRTKFDENNKFRLIEEIYNSLVKNILPHFSENGTSYPWQNSSNYQFWKFMGTMQYVLGSPILFQTDVMPAVQNCTTAPTLYIRPANPNRWTPENNDVLDFFIKYIASNHNASFTTEDIEDTKTSLLSFRGDISDLYTNTSSFTNEYVYNSKTSVTLKITELTNRFPSIDWLGFFNGLFEEDFRNQYFASDPLVIIENKDYFDSIASLINTHGQLTVSNFGFFYILLNYVKFFEAGRLKVADRRGRDITVFSDDLCLDLVVKYFSPVAMRLLCEEYKIDAEDWKNDISLMKDLTISSFIYLIRSSDWLSHEEKLLLIEKAKTIKFYGDIPSWITDDNAIARKTPKYDNRLSLVENDILAQKVLFQQQINPLLSGVDDDAPPMLWQNAWNKEGDIRFLVGIQMPPFYQYGYPLAVKYGSTSIVIGHELIHSFVTNLYYAKENRLALKNSTYSVLKSKYDCLIPFYNEYCESEKETNVTSQPCTVGEKTVEENNADTEGLKIAYTAFKFAEQTIGSEPALNDLSKYTANQIFFMSYARRSCGVATGLQYVKGDPHSSKKARIEQPLMNFPAFAKAFNCQSGQRFFRQTTCSIYGQGHQ